MWLLWEQPELISQVRQLSESHWKDERAGELLTKGRKKNLITCSKTGEKGAEVVAIGRREGKSGKGGCRQDGEKQGQENCGGHERMLRTDLREGDGRG